jgi:hypothetical protein
LWGLFSSTPKKTQVIVKPLLTAMSASNNFIVAGFNTGQVMVFDVASKQITYDNEVTYKT